MQINRIRLTALVVATLLGMLGTNAKASPPITGQSPLTWLRVSAPSDPQFGSLVKQAIGEEATAALADVLPYSVVVTNNGSSPLVGVAVRFHLKTGERTVTRDFFYYSFPQPNNPIFAPGQSRLITPLKESNAVAHGRARRSTASARSVAETQVIADLAATQNIHVVVDLVIAQDGSTAGTDEARTIQQMTAQAQAYHDMASEALTRLNGGSDAQVTEWLTTLSRRRVPPRHKGETADQYAAVQQSVATGWLGYIRSGKRSELMSKLTTITTGEDRTFTFLKSIHGGLQ